MSKELYKFEVEFLKEAIDFIKTLDTKTQEKVLENIRISRFKTDPKLFKKVDKDIWEFRTRYLKSQIRLLAFWDKQKGSLVICTHGFVKKTKKLPSKEIGRAKKLRKIYFESKK